MNPELLLYAAGCLGALCAMIACTMVYVSVSVKL